MKTLSKALCLLAVFACALSSACTKSDAPPAGKKYTSDKGTMVNLSSSQWYVTRFTTGSGGTVNLKLEGTTNADRIVLKTHGDGLISNDELMLTSGKKFSSDGTIYFTATSVPPGNFTRSTELIAYKGGDVFVVTLESGELHY
jgi:hypothetical protein